MPSRAWTICYTDSMLSRSRRISRVDFPNPRIPSYQWTGSVLRIRAIHKNSPKARVAIVAAKKYYRTKITRNVFKRRVFSVLQKELSLLDNTPFGFFLIFPIIHTQDITFAAIASDIDAFIKQITKNHA